MKAKVKFLSHAFALVVASFIIFSSCEKNNNETLPSLSTAGVSDITQTSALSGGDITDDGGALVTARGVCWSTSQNPTISDSHTNDGSGTGSFSSNVSGLESNKTYFIRAYGTNSQGTAYGNEISFSTPEDLGCIDGDGNVYETVILGTQEWMTENLKTTKYNDGSAIPLISDDVEWVALTTPGYCWYNNDGSTYGGLYNWFTVNTDKLCPSGWHVPNNDEWIDLCDFAGGESIAATKLKATSGWEYNSNGSDDYGFSALPGGHRGIDGQFSGIGISAYWWSSTEGVASTAVGRTMGIHSGLNGVSTYRHWGFSVRCIRN